MTTPNQNPQTEVEELRREFDLLLPTVSSALNCARHGWIDPEVMDYWHDRLFELMYQWTDILRKRESVAQANRQALSQLDRYRERSSISSASR